MEKWTLFGSRARGTARSDSDWDVLYIPDVPLVVDAHYWGDASRQILSQLGWDEGVERLREEARQELGIPADGDIDLFVAVSWGTTTAAQLKWDGGGCLEGWLTSWPG